MDRLLVYLITGCMVIMIECCVDLEVLLIGIGPPCMECKVGSITMAHTCYFCEDHNNPFGGDCWNQTAKVAKIVNCTKPCYTTTFQRGGGDDYSNYLLIKKGCTGLHNDEDNCEESKNCNSKHFGACTTCCSQDLCNGGPAMYSLPSAAIVCLTLSLLFSLPFTGIVM